MDTLKKTLQQREKPELVAIIQHMLRQEPESWVFKFNPGQRLRALFGWSSTYSGEL
jgi:DNA-binding protein HU-beta